MGLAEWRGINDPGKKSKNGMMLNNGFGRVERGW